MTARDVLRRPGYAVGRQTSVLQQLHSNYIQRSVAGHLRNPVELPGRTGAAKVINQPRWLLGALYPSRT